MEVQLTTPYHKLISEHRGVFTIEVYKCKTLLKTIKSENFKWALVQANKTIKATKRL
jgi:hypothetical protein